MEKVKIKNCIDTGRKTKDNDNPIIEIELEDGRKGSAFDSLFLGLPKNEYIEIEIKQGKEYNGEERFYFLMPGQKSKKTYSKDWGFEKRKSSLEIAVSAIQLTEEKVSSENILALSEKFYEYLNKK